jgi:hypothetical protein
MPWQCVQDTGYVDSVPEDSGRHPVLVVMSATCTVQMRLHKTADINTQKADGSHVTSVHQFFSVPHNIITAYTMNTTQQMSHIWHNHSNKHVFCNLISCSLAQISWCFRWTHCLHHYSNMDTAHCSETSENFYHINFYQYHMPDNIHIIFLMATAQQQYNHFKGLKATNWNDETMRKWSMRNAFSNSVQYHLSIYTL